MSAQPDRAARTGRGATVHTGPPVLAGVDLSAAARAAADLAAADACRRGTALLLVHGYTTPWVELPAVDPMVPAPPLPRTRAARYLERLAEAVRTAWPGLDVRAELVDGPAAKVLRDLSRGAAVLVVGHRGDGGVAGLLIGSVAVRTATHAYCPVVVVRGQPGAPGAPVVVGVDGSPAADLAARFALAEAARRGAPLVVVHACAADSPTGAAIARGVAPLAGSLRHPAVQVRTELVYGQQPAAALARVAAGAGLLVVGSRGLDGLRGRLLGSVGMALIGHAPCPVAVVPPGSG